MSPVMLHDVAYTVRKSIHVHTCIAYYTHTKMHVCFFNSINFTEELSACSIMYMYMYMHGFLNLGSSTL